MRTIALFLAENLHFASLLLGLISVVWVWRTKIKHQRMRTSLVRYGLCLLLLSLGYNALMVTGEAVSTDVTIIQMIYRPILDLSMIVYIVYHVQSMLYLHSSAGKMVSKQINSTISSSNTTTLYRQQFDEAAVEPKAAFKIGNETGN